MTFTENMNRIERLKHQVMLDIEAEDYHAAKEHLDSIHIYTANAQQQLEQFRLAKSQSEMTSGDSGL